MCRGVLLPHGWCFPRLYPSPTTPEPWLLTERRERRQEWGGGLCARDTEYELSLTHADPCLALGCDEK